MFGILSLRTGSLGWADSSARGVTGSLLDDNQWHDVELVREDKNITVSVDRVPVNITVGGEFKRLDLDRYVSTLEYLQSDWFYRVDE